MLAPDFEKNLTIQDRVRLQLDKYGQKRIPITISDLARDMKMPEPTVYQVINRLRQNNEIQLDKETLPNGREKIVGIELIRLTPTGRTYKRASERSGKIIRFKPREIPDKQEIPPLPNLAAYLDKKVALEDMKKRAREAGLDETVVTFNPDPIAEEGILLLSLYTDLKKSFEELQESYQRQGFDLEAERRNVEHLKGKLQEETIKELRLMEN